jgi:hypothetical protein
MSVSNISRDETSTLNEFNDIGGAPVVYIKMRDLILQQLSNTAFYIPMVLDVTADNNQIVKTTHQWQIVET